MKAKKPQSGWAAMNRWRKIAAIGGAVGAVVSAMAAGANATKMAEPYWVATRGFVSDEMKLINDRTLRVIDRLETRQINTQLYIASTQRKLIENEIASKEALLKQNPTMQWEARSIIEEQIRNLNRDLELAKQTADGLSKEILTRRN